MGYGYRGPAFCLAFLDSYPGTGGMKPAEKTQEYIEVLVFFIVRLKLFLAPVIDFVDEVISCEHVSISRFLGIDKITD